MVLTDPSFITTAVSSNGRMISFPVPFCSFRHQAVHCNLILPSSRLASPVRRHKTASLHPDSSLSSSASLTYRCHNQLHFRFRSSSPIHSIALSSYGPNRTPVQMATASDRLDTSLSTSTRPLRLTSCSDN